MPKIDKRGKITIPNHIRNNLGFFPGMKVELRHTDKQIILTPYNYRCKECGIEIPEGTQRSWCEKCVEKHVKYIY